MIRWRWLALDLAIVAALGVFVAFPFVADSSASGEHASAPAPALPRLPASGAGGTVSRVPEFSPGSVAGLAASSALRSPSAFESVLRQTTRAELGDVDGRVADEILRATKLGAKIFGPGADVADYPIRPVGAQRLRSLLPARPTRAEVDGLNDTAALLMLAPGWFGDGSDLHTAGTVAWVLLDRARQTGACRPQLNLAFLVSANSYPLDDATANEFARAVRACPGDPTPLWLLGQFQSIRAYVLPHVLRVGQTLPLGERLLRPFTTFHRLEAQFPRSPAGWSGEADAELRLGYQTTETQPFTARARFARALLLYRRAEELAGGRDAELLNGEARALAGLHRYGEAEAAARRAVTLAPPPAVLHVRAIEFAELAHDFRGALGLNKGSWTHPDGTALFAAGQFNTDGYGEDADWPVSLGVTTLYHVRLAVGVEGGGASTAVADLSFIPRFRAASGLTQIDRWCTKYDVWYRDHLLAGDVSEAVDGLAALVAHPDTAGVCGPVDRLLAVAERESGQTAAAAQTVRSSGESLDAYAAAADPALALVDEERQNLWRWAGRLDHALAASRDWIAADPRDPLAYDRRGEIEFLQRRYDLAAQDFARAVALVGSPNDQLSRVELAEARLKEGAALELEGLLSQASTALATADGDASALASPDCLEGTSGQSPRFQALVVSYHARAQAGEVALRRGRYAEAVSWYERARERETQIVRFYDSTREHSCPVDPITRQLRPEVVENNEALAEIKLGHSAEAIADARRAVSFDPGNPVFRQTLGFAFQVDGEAEKAARWYGAAVAADPLDWAAQNDLGVALARTDDRPGALRAFRRAIAANPRYALAWFNLGVVLEEGGIGDLLEAQGALGKAARLDHRFRTADRTPTFDDRVYFNALDLSKPLPGYWSFGKTQQRVPLAPSILVLLLTVWGALKAGGSERLRHFISERTLEWSRGARVASFLQPRTLWLACVATVAVFVWPLFRAGEWRSPETPLFLAGIVVLLGLYLRTRARVARRDGRSVRSYTWPPAVGFGAAATLVGLGWAPLPVADGEDAPSRVHRAGPFALALATAAFLALGRAYETPLLRSLAEIGIVMTASALTPVRPYDGAFVTGRLVKLAIQVALIATAVLLFVGVL